MSQQTSDAPYRILYISSYNYEYMSVPDQLNGFDDGLDSSLSVDVVHEFMDAKNLYRSEDIREFYHYLKYKLDRTDPFDLVVLSDDTALHFGLNYANRLFPNTPVVFMGINNLSSAETAASREGFTGIAEVVDYKSNSALFRKLFPAKTHVVVVTDNSNTGQGEFIEYEKYADHYGVYYDTINTSYYTKEGLISAFSSIDDNSIVLLMDILSDGEEHSYTAQEMAQLISRHAPDTPIFRATLADIGNGVLGGVSYSFYDAGVNAGTIASRILTSTNPDSIPLMTDAVTKTYFEQSAMDRFSISKYDLPEETVIINQHQTAMLFYEENMLMMNLIFLVVLLMVIIIINLTRFNRRQASLINHDFMTGIHNRTFITTRLSQAVSAKKPFGLIMMDVDHFKTINDTLGHGIGDELLIEVARKLKAFSEKEVLFARIGGDEFMGFITESGLRDTEKICQRMMRMMHKTFHLSCGSVHITVSIGAALYPKHTDDPGRLQGLADKALYEVKEAGRDGYVIYYE